MYMYIGEESVPVNGIFGVLMGIAQIDGTLSL